ncbi:hypothetical protein LJC56_05480 [Christensenellaceae bacterium OttesenSCG-928-K19]|nr:hypothetical protein [Christensenellaceae bacterium OttesenSCG-928-K19]
MKSEKDLDLPLYYDFYGSFLTEKQAKVFEMYYNDDLSLAEIAQEMEISRQGVMDTVKRSRKKLYDMEEKLGLVKKELEGSNGV